MNKRLLPAAVLLAGLAVLFITDNYYRGQAQEEATRQLNTALKTAEWLLEAGLRERIHAVEDLRVFMATHEELPDRTVFERYAAASLAHHSAMRALQYADEENIIRYIHPLKGNEAALNLDLMTRPAAPYVTKARRDRVTTVSAPVVTVQGSRSIVIRSPIFRDNTYLGLAQGVVDIEMLLADVSTTLTPRFAVTLADAEGDTFWQSGEITEPAVTAELSHWRLTLSRAGGRPETTDLTIVLLWSLGGALLMALMFIVNQFAVRMDLLNRAVEEKTRELMASENRFTTLIEQASEGIVVADAATTEFTYANPAICRFLGYSKQEMLRMKVQDIHPREKLAELMTDFRNASSGGKSFTQEAPCLTKAGDIVYADISATSMEVDGRLCNVGFFRDVTLGVQFRREKEDMEAHLSQAQKLEAIGTLAGGIAHDFNNILGIIFGYAQIAKEESPPGSQMEEDLENVLIAAHRAKDLVNQILAFSRQSRVEPIPLKLQPLIKEGMKMLRSSIPTTISITERVDPTVGAVLADPTQVHQILMNLCTNAYHAMEETGGELAVSLQKTSIMQSDSESHPGLAPGDYAELVVADTGTGIGPDVIDRIFDPFFTTKEKGKGTGMGLSIIHGIMSDYGGTITVESRLGQGSAFHVYFPVTTGREKPVTDRSEDIPRGHERILFIDDEELLARMGKDMLERLGYQVTMRRSSPEALEKFKNNPQAFDLVITDQTMPEITGSELAGKMLRIRPDIPIILCTGYSNLIDADSAKAIGIREFVLKPISKTGMAKLIRQVLDNRPAPVTQETV